MAEQLRCEQCDTGCIKPCSPRKCWFISSSDISWMSISWVWRPQRVKVEQHFCERLDLNPTAKGYISEHRPWFVSPLPCYPSSPCILIVTFPFVCPSCSVASSPIAPVFSHVFQTLLSFWILPFRHWWDYLNRLPGFHPRLPLHLASLLLCGE